MSERNKQIEDFLRYYYALPSAPQYAVMLKGKWGSGKTWFIRKSIEKLEESGGKALYISLYGINSTRQIEQEFFRQLHPALGSKGAMLAGKLLKGFARGALKIDLDGDGKEDGSLSVGIPELNLPEYLRNTDGFVLVFDDVERCSMPICDLLGYINHFVEHGDYKAVLVANEDEMANAGEDYRRIKEKLIGKTFEIEPELNSAVAAFIDEVDSSDEKHILNQNYALIQELYTASKYNNLRYLRQAILDYTRLLGVLDGDALAHKELLTHLLQMLLIYSFEIKSGGIQPAEIAKIKSSFYTLDKSKEGLYRRLSSKYVGIDFLDSLLPPVLWESMFSTGLIDLGAVNEALKSSKYFICNSQPDWVRLWDAYSLPDDEFELLLAAVSDRFQKNEYEEIGVLRHIVGTLLMLSETELCAKSKKEILDVAYKNIEAVKATGSLRKQFAGGAHVFADTGFAGYGFHSVTTPEFQEFNKHLKERGKAAVLEGYPEEAKELLSLMNTDTRKFCLSLVWNEQGEHRYDAVPILMHIDPGAFVESALKLSPTQLSLVTGALRTRYSADHTLRPESTWLRDVAKRLNTAKAGRRGKITGVHLGLLEDGLTEAADLLEAASATSPA